MNINDDKRPDVNEFALFCDLFGMDKLIEDALMLIHTW
jgi:hypothetical protein